MAGARGLGCHQPAFNTPEELYIVSCTSKQLYLHHIRSAPGLLFCGLLFSELLHRRTTALVSPAFAAHPPIRKHPAAAQIRAAGV
jgi:hypothetical protein